jgi:RNA polymerase sigma-70 factor, ECF subfamily
LDKEIIKKRINDWYSYYSNDIFRYAFFMIGERDQAKDILQETFIRAFIKYETFDGMNPKGWLFRIARNLTIDYIRKRKPISYLFNFMPNLKSTEKNPEEIVILNEIERLLYKSLNKIKLQYKDVIILRKIKGFSIAETAQILGWSENKVKVNLHRGMQTLKKELEKEGYNYEVI